MAFELWVEGIKKVEARALFFSEHFCRAAS